MDTNTIAPDIDSYWNSIAAAEVQQLARRALGGFARNDIRCRRSPERSGFLRRVYVSGYMVDGHVDGDFQRAT